MRSKFNRISLSSTNPGTVGIFVILLTSFAIHGCTHGRTQVHDESANKGGQRSFCSRLGNVDVKAYFDVATVSVLVIVFSNYSTKRIILEHAGTEEA